MPRHEIELAPDRPYPVRILQVPATRGQLLDRGEPLCVVQWADDEVQRIVLDTAVVVDTLGVRAGETLEKPGVLALVRPAEDALQSVSGPPAAGGTDAVAPSEATRSLRGAPLWSFLLLAAATGFFAAGAVYRLPWHPGAGLGFLAGGALLLAWMSRRSSKLGPVSTLAVFALAAILAGLLGGRTERTTDWLSGLATGSRGGDQDGLADEFDGPELTDVRLPTAGVPAGSPTANLLDQYAWTLGLCQAIDASCLDDGLPQECKTRLDSLLDALGDAIPTERLERQMELVEIPPASAFRVADDETCDEYLWRAEPLLESARMLLEDEAMFLRRRADELGVGDEEDALERFLSRTAKRLGSCNLTADRLEDEQLAEATRRRAEALHRAFPIMGVEIQFLIASRRDSDVDRDVLPDVARAEAQRCRTLLEDVAL